MSIIMNGKELAQQLSKTQKERVEALVKQHDYQPSLCVVTVGENDASNVYVRQKKRACEELGILFHHVVLPNTVDQLGLSKCLLHDKYVCSSDGVILQLPIPKHLNPVKAGECIPSCRRVRTCEYGGFAKRFAGCSGAMHAKRNSPHAESI